jgi:glycosyltransferase involved in cell wall biosynthesis
MRRTDRLRVTYLLDGSALFGGTKVALAQANLLSRRGHEVTVISRDPAPDWHPVEARFLVDPALDPRLFPPSDVVVATFWRTIPHALAAPAGVAAHYCQGLEYTYTHNAAEHPAIVDQYRRKLPALCVSPHLESEIRTRFGRPARTVVQPLDGAFSPDHREAPNAVPRLVVAGPFEIDWKGVATALRAAEKLRRDGVAFRLVRVSQWPETAEERSLLAADEFHCHLHPAEMADLLRGADLLLAPSWEQEGFGLPALEAMASGVPVVASDVASYRGFASSAATLVRKEDTDGFARAARELLEDGGRWSDARRAGVELAKRFSADRAAESAEAALAWVAGGAPAH